MTMYPEANNIRSLFPALSRKVYGKDLVYLDNAATSQRPQSVIDCWNRLTVESTANIHRAVHALAAEATDAYEQARDEVMSFINAGSRQEIVFTSGATAAINMVAFCFGEAFVNEGDEIIVTEAEHHSNIVSWQLMCQRRKAVLKVLPVDEDGMLMVSELERLITPQTRILAVTHVSNVLGIVNPVKEIVSIAHSHGVPVLVDGAQGIVHCKVDVQDIDCDFYAFSGHKIYAATGTGVLYGKKKYLEAFPPYMGGGEMVGTVKFSGTTYAPLPMKFEAGTQNYTCAATLKPALEVARDMSGTDMADIVEYMTDSLDRNPLVRLYGVPRGTCEKVPLFSFSVEGVHHEDIALILDKMGVAARSGQMCAEPLMDRYGVTGMLRVSFAPYNTMAEAEYFIKCLDRAIKMLR